MQQRWDEDRNAYVNETGSYQDWQGNEVVVDLRTGLITPPEERGRNLSPPLEPQSGGAEFNPGGFGEGVDLEQSITAGSAQPDNGLLSGQSEGLVPPGAGR